MATQYFIKRVGLLAVLLLAGCSSDGQQGAQQGDEPVNGAEKSNNAAMEDPSLNGGAKKNTSEGAAMNNATSGKGVNNFSGANGTNGAAMNNALLDNPTGTGGAPNPASNPTAIPLNQTTALNTGAGDALGGANTANSPTPNNAGNGNNANAVAEDAAAAPAKPAANFDRMNASPFKNPQMNWPGRGKVKYVTRHATKHATPNGPVVGEVVQGDHPLIYQNGNWVELQNGTFIKGNSMTDSPVGFERKTGH